MDYGDDALSVLRRSVCNTSCTSPPFSDKTIGDTKFLIALLRRGFILDRMKQSEVDVIWVTLFVPQILEFFGTVNV